MRRGLREELSRDMGVAWQIMRALEMMGERVMREALACWTRSTPSRKQSLRHPARSHRCKFRFRSQTEIGTSTSALIGVKMSSSAPTVSRLTMSE